MTTIELLAKAESCARKYDAEKAATRSYVRLFDSVKAGLRRILSETDHNDPQYSRIYSAYGRVNRFDTYSGNLSQALAEALSVVNNPNN